MRILPPFQDVKPLWISELCCVDDASSFLLENIFNIILKFEKQK